MMIAKPKSRLNVAHMRMRMHKGKKELVLEYEAAFLGSSARCWGVNA
jgi:hypothetical protein